MPQMNKGGKFIFGRSLIRDNGAVRLPTQAMAEYGISAGGKVYLFSGSRATGGFCVTRTGLLAPSKLGHILTDIPQLANDSAPPGTFLRYKGRFYCWTGITGNGEIVLTDEMMELLKLAPGMRLLCIRSSNIAFTMGAMGPLLERAAHFRGAIPEF